MDIDQYIQILQKVKILSQKQFSIVTQKIKQILLQQSNVQSLSSPIIISGNIHGQFYDLLQLFSIAGTLKQTQNQFLFLGDYISRGGYSIQTFQYLICLKIKYPFRITLLRGHHQCQPFALIYGFYDQIKKKYGNYGPFKYFCQIFNFLPFGATINQKIFCVHGGLSPQLKTITQMRLLQRLKESVGCQGPITDLLWSSPQNIQDWSHSPKGTGKLFGKNIVKNFNHINDFQLIVRSHEIQQDGYIYNFQKYNGQQSNSKDFVTIWSVPNYCYRWGNLAAILKLDEKLQRQFIVFKSIPQSQISSQSHKLFPYFI